jgi:hypothetical protein
MEAQIPIQAITYPDNKKCCNENKKYHILSISARRSEKNNSFDGD